jgi:hypothetical protein
MTNPSMTAEWGQVKYSNCSRIDSELAGFASRPRAPEKQRLPKGSPDLVLPICQPRRRWLRMQHLRLLHRQSSLQPQQAFRQQPISHWRHEHQLLKRPQTRCRRRHRRNMSPRLPRDTSERPDTLESEEIRGISRLVPTAVVLGSRTKASNAFAYCVTWAAFRGWAGMTAAN